MVGVADLEITLILGRAQACGLVVLVTAAEGHAGERAHAWLGTHPNPNRRGAALCWRVGYKLRRKVFQKITKQLKTGPLRRALLSALYNTMIS